jgi:hypothetical protein
MIPPAHRVADNKNKNDFVVCPSCTGPQLPPLTPSRIAQLSRSKASAQAPGRSAPPAIDRASTVLAAQTPDLHTALRRVAAEGWSHIILDGKLFDTDRLAETTTNVNDATIDAWYSGKHRDFGANIQAVMRPDGLPIWTSNAMPTRRLALPPPARRLSRGIQ